jgi:hypothetical protein
MEERLYRCVNCRGGGDGGGAVISKDSKEFLVSYSMNYVFKTPRQARSIQSARLSFQSSELGPPKSQPLTPYRSVTPHPFGPKGGDTLACGGGGGEDPIPTKGQTLWYSM